ncbi:flagellar transcriptional regulator FlhD [Enterobacter cloacae complex sp. 301C7]|uniref:flagellar transcriptional regulator FlhD n=1 Tax=Enterobacter cloacae complex sp. 301C7 TaxID=3395848 RepID=UPI003CF75EAE
MKIMNAEIERQIWDHNLSYLLLAQRVLNHYEDTALFRLGIDKCTGDKLLQLVVARTGSSC